MKQFPAVIAALAGALALSSAASAQEDCPRGTSTRPIATATATSLPTRRPIRSKLVNPSTLIFAYTPVEDPAVYAKAWDGFIKHMEKTTGKKVVFFPVQSNAAQIEAMRSGRLHVGGLNTGGNPIAVNCAGFVPFAIMGSAGRQFGYEMEIIVPADSPIKTPADLKGKKVAFTAPTSNSGFKAPSAILKADFNLEAEARLQAGVLRQARQLDPRRRQQGLRRRGDRQRGDVPHVRPQSVRPRQDPLDLQVGDLPDHRLRLRLQSRSEARREDQAGVLHLPLGGLGAEGRVQERGPFVPIDLQEGLGVLRKIDEATGVKYTCK